MKKRNKKTYLSYVLDANTPTYGNRNRFIIEKKSSILKGDVANDSFIKTTTHIGTHLDMPYHFYDNGQTIEDFDIEFFSFEKVLFININPTNIVVNNDLKDILEKIEDKEAFEALIVKTGICYKRKESIFWEKNYGFDPSLANFLREKFPNIRLFGFDSISVSSYSNRLLGRVAHKAFLDPKRPILLLEDMDLTQLKQDSNIESLIVAPLRISKCDGLPCTVIAEIK